MQNNTPSTASEWAVRVMTKNFTERDLYDLEKWLEGDVDRQRALASALIAAEVASTLSPDVKKYLHIQSSAESIAVRRQSVFRPWSVGSWGPAIAVIILLVGAGLWSADRLETINPQEEKNVVRTTLGQITHYSLPDGSTVSVNADSMIRMDFSETERRVVLERGEAYFEVEKDENRPFVVRAGAQDVIVTGTEFDVAYNSRPNSIQVAVVGGHVRVRPQAPSHGDPVENKLMAGDVFLFSENAPPVRQKVAASLVSSWRVRTLNFDSALLSDVLLQVNRHTQKRLVLDDARLGDVLITGSFHAGDVKSVLFVLEKMYRLQPDEMGNNLVLKVKPDKSPAN